MPRERILVVEDEEDIQELVRYNLIKDGYRVDTASSGEEALQLINQAPPNLIVLDLMLPGITGLEVTKTLKNNPRTLSIPIVMLTARSEESDIIIGLELGAEDYVTKPFSPRVLLARVRACLRRKVKEVPADQAILRLGDLIIDPVKHLIAVKGAAVELTATEFRVLHFLARKPGWVFTRQQIVDAVKGEDYAVTERSVDVQMVGLRRKLGACAEYIETIRGVGYRFRDTPADNGK
jgi:two-component system, OmpR family, alkaline phosphatase synthesis response regulator PhoP